MKKIFITIAALILALPVSADTIKIGLGIPMTGDYAPYSEWQGARCMAEMINAKGGVNGMQIEVLTQDSGADTQTAISLAQKFLDEGDKVKVTMRFRGREMAHQELGVNVLNRVRDDTDEVAKIEAFPKLEGRQMIMVIAPK